MSPDFVSSLSSELSYRYNRMKDGAIYNALIKSEGGIPHPETMRVNGQFVRTSQGSDEYEEFRWRGKPMFQIRLKFQEYKATIEIKELS
jgi:hypothetical protein